MTKVVIYIILFTMNAVNDSMERGFETLEGLSGETSFRQASIFHQSQHPILKPKGLIQKSLNL
jgi:hypothetical protein